MGLLDIFDAVTPIVQKALDFIPDPVEKAKAQQELTLAQMQFAQAQFTGQLSVNSAEAANKSTFVAGWRPFVGWCCGAAFAWDYVLQPALADVSAVLGHVVALAPIDISGMMPVLLGMLGLGAMRTVEKVNGVQTGK
jgi:dienelactone hydrolase